MRQLRPGLLPIIFLVIIIAWALFAVLMLTGTLVSAQQIDGRVKVINTILPPIDQNLKTLPLAVRTGEIAEKIQAAAAPLSPQLGEVLRDVGNIEGNAKSINDNANEINKSVKSIGGLVQTIGGNVRTIDASLRPVRDNVLSINASVRSINGSFDGIRSRVFSIDDGAKGINNRADTVEGIARDVLDDTRRLNDELVPDIVRNSQAIEDSPLLLQNLKGLFDALGIQGLPLPAIKPPLPSIQPPPIIDEPLLMQAPQLPAPIPTDGDKKESSGLDKSLPGKILGR